jgi:hypothetical protein
MSMTSNTEQLFLKIFKFVVMVLMGLSLLGSIVALVAGLWFLTAKPKEPEPVKSAPKNEVNIDEFLDQLDKQKEAPKEEKKVESPKEAPLTFKYLDESRKIVACLNESNKKSNLNLPLFSEEATEDFRSNIERIADAPRYDRGQPYVTDATRVVCAILLHEKVISLRSKNNELRVFIPAVNFHIQKWDEIKAEARKFEAAEKARFEAEMNAEELRVEIAKKTGLNILIGAGAAFGLFMAIALYLIIAAMESHLRSISRSLKLSRSENELKID